MRLIIFFKKLFETFLVFLHIFQLHLLICLTVIVAEIYYFLEHYVLEFGMDKKASKKSKQKSEKYRTCEIM